MKGIRIIFFSFFVFTALISINMIYNLVRQGFGYGMWSIFAVAFAYIALGVLFFIVKPAKMKSSVENAA